MKAGGLGEKGDSPSGRRRSLLRSRRLRVDDDVNQTVQDGTAQALRFFQWFQGGPPGRGGVEAPIPRRPATALTLVVAVVVIGLTVLMVLSVIALMLKVFEYGVEPILGYVLGRLFPLLFLPGALPVLALLVITFGLIVARKFRPDGPFMGGLFCVALGIVCLSQLPRVMAALPTREARLELDGLILIVGLVISGFLVVCGFQLIGSCRWVRAEPLDDDE
jgi:hypothetical protein